jgi:hypothetical protein
MAFAATLGTVTHVVGSVSTTAGGAVAWSAVRLGQGAPGGSRWSGIDPSTPVTFCLILGAFDHIHDPLPPGWPDNAPVAVVLADSGAQVSLEYNLRSFRNALVEPLPGVARAAVPELGPAVTDDTVPTVLSTPSTTG